MLGLVVPITAALLGLNPSEPASAPSQQEPPKAKATTPPSPPKPPAAPNAAPTKSPAVIPQSQQTLPTTPAPAPVIVNNNVPVIASKSGPVITSAALPAEITAELAAIESMHRSVLVNLPIEEWKFDNVRARYQTLLKQAGANPAVAAEIQSRLARLTKHEQASQSARTVATILAQSRRRDRTVASIESRLAASQSAPVHTYTAAGFVQPSSSMYNGHKVFALIGPTGSTIAYLDIPPGLDVNAHFSHRVGVNGVMHYNEDLGARLITVRDIEPLHSARR